MQLYPLTELKCLPRLPYSTSRFLQYPLSFNKGNLSCIHSKCWSKDLFISPVIKMRGFFELDLTGAAFFLIFPFLLFSLSPRWTPTTTFHLSTRFLSPLSPWVAFPMTLLLRLTQEGQRERDRGWIPALGTQPLMAVGNWSSGRQCSRLYWKGKGCREWCWEHR